MSALKRFCGFMDSRNGRWIAFAVAILAATSSNQSRAATIAFEGMRIEVVGSGAPLLMIPGLNSAGEVWTETCKALQPEVQCHIVQLPGFAGQPPVVVENWLLSMRDRLSRYIVHAKLDRPALIGHSLGGVLGMQLALKAPPQISRLIIVDSLPFFAGARMPGATLESVLPIATTMREGMLAADESTYREQTRSSLAAMSNQTNRRETLIKWGDGSDRSTTAQTMFEILTTDLRPSLAELKTPTLVLGAWAGSAAFGATAESTRQTFVQQYAALDGVQIEISDTGYHFLMWDDPQWLQQQLRGFLKLPSAR